MSAYCFEEQQSARTSGAAVNAFSGAGDNDMDYCIMHLHTQRFATT